MPQATLASIVVVALKGLYFQVRDIYKFFKLSWIDMVSLSRYKEMQPFYFFGQEEEAEYKVLVE